MLCFNEELMDIAAGVNEDAPRREWTPQAVQSVAAVGRKLLLFAADKARVPLQISVVFFLLPLEQAVQK